MRKVYPCSWMKFFGKSNSDGLKAQKPCLSPKIGHDKPIIKPKNIIQSLGLEKSHGGNRFLVNCHGKSNIVCFIDHDIKCQ